MTFTHDALDFTKGNLPHPIVQTCSTWTHCTGGWHLTGMLSCLVHAVEVPCFVYSKIFFGE